VATYAAEDFALLVPPDQVLATGSDGFFSSKRPLAPQLDTGGAGNHPNPDQVRIYECAHHDPSYLLFQKNDQVF
jgi:hypothetical protein